MVHQWIIKEKTDVIYYDNTRIMWEASKLSMYSEITITVGFPCLLDKASITIISPQKNLVRGDSIF